MNADTHSDLKRRHAGVAVICFSVVAMMVGLAYAAVPLYRIFCQVTGFGGTTQVAVSAPDTVLERQVKVRFDANVASGLGWSFEPEQREVEVKVGEQTLAYYKARNLTGREITGTASFNVTPLNAGRYFSKVECFCFTEQTLKPGEAVDMPVTFYVDPAIADDPDLDSLHTITLSYTFFAKKSSGRVSRVQSGETSDVN